MRVGPEIDAAEKGASDPRYPVVPPREASPFKRNPPEHLGQGYGNDHEVGPLGPYGEKAEQGSHTASDGHGRDNGKPKTLDACHKEESNRVPCRAEVCRVAHRWKPRMAHEYVEARGEYGKYANLDGETDVVGAHEKREERPQRQGRKEKQQGSGLSASLGSSFFHLFRIGPWV